MLYYKVKPEADQTKKYIWKTKNGTRCVVRDSGDILIKNELFTPGERAKIANSDRFFTPVNIKKSAVYFFFGARFVEV